MSTEAPLLPRVLGAFQAFSIIVGGVVGASIFIVPGLVEQSVHSLWAVLLVWLLAAALTLAGVLTVSELAAMLPEAGGGYVYIRAALGPTTAFLFAWTDALIVRAGAAATISFTFALYFSQIIPVPFGWAAATWQGVLSIALLWLLAALNITGASSGANLQVVGTLLKVLALAAAIVLPFLLWRGTNNLHFTALGPVTAGGAAMVATALVPVLWAYGGWEQLAHLAEEVRDPGRILPRVFFTGMITVAVLYIGVVIGIHYVLPSWAVAASSVVGFDLFRRLLGPTGAVLMAAIIMMAAVVSANGAVMAGPRSCFAAARDGYAPSWLSRIHPRHRSPANAILLLAGWSTTLILASLLLLHAHPGNRPLVDLLISYVMFGYLGFQAMTMLSALVLRRAHPEWTRPFRVPGYPWVPLASFCGTVFLMAMLARSSPAQAVAGILIVLSGVPAAWLYRAKRNAARIVPGGAGSPRAVSR